MTTLEKILQEIDEKIYAKEKPYDSKETERWLNPPDKFNYYIWAKGMRDAQKIIKKHLSDNDGWITVDPNNIPDREVLCCDEYGEQLIGYLSKTEEGWICESGECTMYYVVGWMEKPEPYRKDGE